MGMTGMIKRHSGPRRDGPGRQLPALETLVEDEAAAAAATACPGPA